MAPDAPTPDPSPESTECFYRYAGPSLGPCDGPVDWTDRLGNPFCQKHRPADPSPDTPSICPRCGSEDVGDAASGAQILELVERIAELEADNRRLATTMTGDTATDLRVLYAYELGIADHTLTTPTEETTE